MGRIVEIGSLREPVEVLDEPQPAPDERIGRIKHMNGENVAISFDTLQELMATARQARSGNGTSAGADGRRQDECLFFA